ncbi:gliding motility-associated C-terminal domain-containing protein [Saprospiraceae bacterium]|nr:gliding motility-associated C-terminal domain-containing protein [Saprospiraceae bacterium]
MNIYKNINIDPVKNTFSRLPQIALVFLLVLFGTTVSQATHIVGGDITYECKGFGDYEVTLTVRLDCENGEEPFDNIAHVGIYDGFGNLLPWFGTGGMILLQNPAIDTINTDLDTGCGLIGEQVCVVQAVYKGTVNIPKRETGYYFTYQRCCRNVTLTNVLDPLNTGSTLYARLLEEEMGENCNSTPTFNQWPNIYECTNSTLSFDHSATDPEGDSLVYRLCAPADGATFDIPQPVPPSGPPYEDVVYKDPFSFEDPMGGVPLSIDPETGMMTATPNAVGQWLVGVCVEEYRDGVLLTTIRRFFEYNTRVCAEGPMALFDAPNPQCDGLELEVTNQSTFADSYLWSVSPDTDVVFDENAINPIFTFPANGIYTVTLEAIRDLDGCSNIFMQDIGVYDSNLAASFDAMIESCPGDSTLVNLTSTSTDPDYAIVSWLWTVSSPGFTDTLMGETTAVTVPTVDAVEITLLVTSENGCTATSTTTFDADPLDLELLANPMAVCQGESVDILVNPNCDLTYTITPLDYVTFDDPDDPCIITISPLEVVTYTVTATDGICTASAEFMLDVIQKSDIAIEGDSISCDGTVSLTVVGTLPGNQFEWSTSPDFMPLIGTMDATLDYTMVDQSETIYVRVKDGTGCSDVVSFDIENQTVDISYPSSITLCTGIEEEIIITNNNPDHDLTIVFDPNPIIVMTTDTSVFINTDDAAINTTITFTATNQYGCEEEGTITIDAEERPMLDFTWDITCGTLEMCFTNTTDPIANDYSWDFGDLTTTDDVSTDVNPCYTYPEAGSYNVTLYITGGACAGDSIIKTIDVPVIPMIEIDSDDLEICLGDMVTLTATTNTEGEIVWSDNSGTIGNGTEIDYTGTGTTDIIVMITDSSGCTDSDTINIDVYIFDLSVDVPEISCVGEEVTVTLTNNSSGNDFTYDWEPSDCIISGEGTPVVVISAQDTKEISVFITNNENGCDTLFTFDFNISVIDKTILSDPAERPFQCQEIEVFVDPANDNCEYEWSTGETESSIMDTILETTTYTVTITDDNGCTLEQSITIDPLLPECNENDVYLPKGFSPNGDGSNDVFRVRSNFVKTMDLAVYDRWGELLFRSTDIDTGWDGTFNGSELAPDVYAICLIATCSNGAEYKMTGNLTLIR